MHSIEGETVQTDPAFPDEGPASRFTKLSANLSGGISFDIGEVYVIRRFASPYTKLISLILSVILDRISTTIMMLAAIIFL